MFLRRTVIFASILLLSAALCFASEHDDYRQHTSHVHGIAHLNVALADNELFIEFESPAVDIAGFEHAPRTEKERADLQTALRMLRQGDRMFAFPPAAGVQLDKTVVKTASPHNSDHEHHDQGEDTDRHHSDILMEYRFYCENPRKVNSIEVMLFKYFKSLTEIRVQLLTPSQQTSFELTPNNIHISF